MDHPISGEKRVADTSGFYARRAEKKARQGVEGTSWGDIILPDLLGATVTYLNSKDVHSLQMTVSLEVGATIKKRYLKRNFLYLENACCMFMQEAGHEYVQYETIVSNWMEANGDDWTSLYDNASIMREGTANRTSFDKIFRTVYMASQFGLVDVVKHLVEKRGADPNEQHIDRHGTICRPIRSAAFSPNLACLCYLLERENIEPNYVLDPRSGLTFLHIAIYFERLDGVELILRHSAVDLNVQSEVPRMTIMHSLCRSIRKGCSNSALHGSDIHRRMRLLLELGADASIVDENGDTPRTCVMRTMEVPSDQRNPNVTDEDCGEMIELLQEYERRAAQVPNGHEDGHED